VGQGVLVSEGRRGGFARRAYMQPHRRAVDEGADALDVRIPAALGPAVGVRHVHPEAGMLATDLANGCHDDAHLDRLHLPETNEQVTILAHGAVHGARTPSGGRHAR